MKIVHEIEKCIGCGLCESLCPKFWKMADDGKAHLKDSNRNSQTGNEELELKEISCNQEAAESCPVQCINIEK